MNRTSETALELRIARAYVKLWCIPENIPEASLLIDSIGNCEVRQLFVYGCLTASSAVEFDQARGIKHANIALEMPRDLQ